MKTLLLIAAATLSACGPSSVPIVPPADQPVMQVVSPAPGLKLTASIDHSRLTTGTSVAFHVDLKNEGTAGVQLPGAGPCSPDLIPVIYDGGGQVVWSEPQRMCAPIGNPVTMLAPGTSLSANRCFTLTAGSVPPGSSSSCAGIALKPGTYRIGGTFYGKALPQLELTLV
jgi:hypothetical protein